MPILTKQPQTAAGPSGASKRSAAYRGRIPTKTNINLALIGVKKTRWWLVILVLVLILAAAAVIAKFLVIDRLDQVSAAQSEAAQVRRQLDDCLARIEEYGELNEIYAHYTYSGMTAEELARVDRVAVMDMLQRVVFPRTTVNSWQLAENQLTLRLEADTLQAINNTVEKLMEEEIVSYCEVNTATTDTGSRRTETVAGEKVAGNIVVYLVKPEEVSGK